MINVTPKFEVSGVRVYKHPVAFVCLGCAKHGASYTQETFKNAFKYPPDVAADLSNAIQGSCALCGKHASKLYAHEVPNG